MLLRVLLAMLAGGLIGFERTYHGRPAGFRTHTLVCLSSALLMLITVYPWEVFLGSSGETLRVDPTRMAQGIMTGIGFLGAGVIMKEGLSIRGLTTAASIWATASIGILIGIGFYFAAALGAVLTLGILSLFRWIEAVTPSLHYARLNVRFHRHEVMPEESLCELIEGQGIEAANPIYSLQDEGAMFEYQMTIRTRHMNNYRRLSETLNSLPGVVEFQVTPTGD